MFFSWISEVKRLLHGQWTNVVTLCEDEQETENNLDTVVVVPKK